MVRQKLRNNGGFTLVEVMLTVGILAVVIVGLLQLFVYCATLAESAGNITLALNDAQSKIEEIRNHDFSSLTTDYGSGGTPGNNFTLNSLNGSGTVTIAQVGGASELLQVQIDAAWQNKNGRNFTQTLMSYAAQR